MTQARYRSFKALCWKLRAAHIGKKDLSCVSYEKVSRRSKQICFQQCAHTWISRYLLGMQDCLAQLFLDFTLLTHTTVSEHGSFVTTGASSSPSSCSPLHFIASASHSWSIHSSYSGASPRAPIPSMAVRAQLPGARHTLSC